MAKTAVKSRKGTQPGLSVTNEEIIKQFPKLTKISKGNSFGPTFIGAIGDKYVGSDGNKYTPVTLLQARNDLYNTTKTEANSFFRGWEGFDSIVRHTENVPPKQMKALKMKVGNKIPNAQLLVDYGTTKFFDKSDGTPQDAVMNPTTENYLVVRGENGESSRALYRNTRLQFEENLRHTGMELRSSAVEVSFEDLQDVLDNVNEDTVITIE